MIFSNSNLQVLGVVGTDRRDAVLHQVRVEGDGSTVASDGKVVMAVEGVTKRPKAFGEFEGEKDAGQRGVAGFGIVPEVVAQAYRNLPKGKLGRELGYAVLTKCAGGTCELTTTDLNKKLKVEGKQARAQFPDWREAFKEARPGAGEKVRRVCVDRRALMKLLRAMDSAAPDPENAVFLEIPADTTKGIVLRGQNVVTGQHVVGLTFPLLSRQEEWPGVSDWERNVVLKAKKKPKRARRKRK